MSQADLLTQANTFADELTDLFRRVLPYDVPSFRPQSARKDDRFQIGPELDTSLGRFNDRFFSLNPLRAAGETKDDEWLSLKVLYTVDLDDARTHLRVISSTMGLWLCTDPTGRKPKRTPVFRVEYERGKRSGSPAHIHFHAESAELAWLYGRVGHPMINMSEVHFPVGGRRFRPTVEDVLKFLDDENLFANWHPGWRSHVDASQEVWHRRQAAAAVRRYPDAAIEQLTKMGHTVTPPKAGSPVESEKSRWLRLPAWLPAGRNTPD